MKDSPPCVETFSDSILRYTITTHSHGILKQNSDRDMGKATGESEFVSVKDRKFFLTDTPSRHTLRPTRSPTQRVP
jgi:hypothetical protein